MLETEWQTLVANINADVSGMLRAQQTLDEVHDDLQRREKSVVEEDFIFEDGWGVDTNAPNIRELYGVRIATRVLHRRGLALRDIKGADLLYEIVGRKFTLVQYKKPNRRGLVERRAIPSNCYNVKRVEFNSRDIPGVRSRRRRGRNTRRQTGSFR